jgi:hypothetical protein
MSDTLSKSASRAAWAASLRQLRAQARQWPWHRALKWTPSVALIVVFDAFLFAWGFLRIVMMLIFARALS